MMIVTFKMKAEELEYLLSDYRAKHNLGPGSIPFSVKENAPNNNYCSLMSPNVQFCMGIIGHLADHGEACLSTARIASGDPS